MFWQNLIAAYALKPVNDREPIRQPNSEAHSDSIPFEEDRWIVCRQCRQRLSRPSERINVNGSHNHVFANPVGIVFEIGCFHLVRGLNFIGPPSFEFPWFAAHSWQIVICSICQSHLGWCFRGQGSNQFFGLILDRLIEIDAPE
jgi:hypothetical protein